jgi:hypothetical protein
MGRKSDYKGCCVHQVGVSEYFLCLVKEQKRDKCPHAKDYGFINIFCNHPDRQEFPRVNLSTNVSMLLEMDILFRMKQTPLLKTVQI